MQKEYVDLSVYAAEELNKNVSVKKLRYSLLCLPSNLKREHKKFLKEAKADIKEAESTDEVMYVVGEHYDYLHYTLLKYVIGLYGNDDLKEKMEKYEEKMKVFRKETRLQIFSDVCADEPQNINGRFTTMVSKHQIELLHWKMLRSFVFRSAESCPCMTSPSTS